MGRPSKLSETQKLEIERRLVAGEKPADLAREYGVNRSAISRGFSQQTQQTQIVAQKLLAAENALKELPFPQQITAVTHLNRLRAISGHVLGAAEYGAATAHRMAEIANNQGLLVDGANPMETQEQLQAISALTRISNDALQPAMALIKANQVTEGDDGDALQSLTLPADPVAAAHSYQRLMEGGK